MPDGMLDLSPGETYVDPRKKRAMSIGQVLLQKAGDTSPITSPVLGVAKLAAGALGGYFEGQEERKQQAALNEGNKAQAQFYGQYLLNGRIGSGAAAALPGASSSVPSVSKSLPSLAGDTDIGRYAKAITSVESGGNYAALGPATKTGDRAYGRYQVMGANIPSWTQAALGRSLTPEEFKNDPQAQDATFAHRFGSYVEKYGNPQDAASAWFTGRPLAQGAGARDVLGTSGAGYVDKFNRALGAKVADAGTPTVNPADLPMAGATPVSYDAMGGYTPDGQDGGFFIPPGSEGAPAIGGGGLTMQIDPSMPMPDVPGPLSADLTPAAMGSISIPGGAPAPVMGADLGTDPTSVPGMYAPPAQVVTGSDIPGMPPAGSFGAPVIPTVPGDPNAGAPLPPARPDQSTLIAAAPLPPTRPDFANIPDAGARQTMGQQLGRALLGSAPPVSAMPDTSNSNDGGAGIFARTNGGADAQALGAALANSRGGQGGTSGNPQAQALGSALLGNPAPAPAPPPVKVAQAALGALPSDAAPPNTASAPQGAPPASVPAQAAPTGGAVPPQVSQAQPAISMAQINALANSPSPVHQAMAKAVFERALKGRETTVVGDALVDKDTGSVVYQGQQKPQVVSEGSTLVGNDGKPLFQAPPKNDETPDQKNYRAAVSGGFKGSFNDFVTQRSQRQPQKMEFEAPDGTKHSLVYDPVENRLKTAQEMGAAPFAPAPAPTNPYSSGGAGVKAPTGDQAKLTGFANRMVSSHNTIAPIEDIGADRMKDLESKVPGIGNQLAGTVKRSYDQAKENFITAILRQESGAAIGKDEFVREERKYFPQPGDDAANIKQKRMARELAIESVMAGAGPAYKVPEDYKPMSRTAPAAPSGPASSVPQAAGGLPAGAKVAPDGQTYVPDPSRGPNAWMRVVR